MHYTVEEHVEGVEDVEDVVNAEGVVGNMDQVDVEDVVNVDGVVGNMDQLEVDGVVEDKGKGAVGMGYFVGGIGKEDKGDDNCQDYCLRNVHQQGYKVHNYRHVVQRV